MFCIVLCRIRLLRCALHGIRRGWGGLLVVCLRERNNFARFGFAITLPVCILIIHRFIAEPPRSCIQAFSPLIITLVACIISLVRSGLSCCMVRWFLDWFRVRPFARVLAKTLLIIVIHQRALEFIAAVQKGHFESVGDISKYLCVARPVDDRTQRHDGGEITVHKTLPGQVGNLHHLAQ